MESSLLFEVILICSGICFGISLASLVFAVIISKVLKDDE
jgi:hypothetical protein